MFTSRGYLGQKKIPERIITAMMNHHHPSSSDRLAAVVVAPGSGRRFPSCDGNMELDIPKTWNSFWITHIYKNISHIYIYISVYIYVHIYIYVCMYVSMYQIVMF